MVRNIIPGIAGHHRSPSGTERPSRAAHVRPSEGNQGGDEQDGAVGLEERRRDSPRLRDEAVVVDPVDHGQEEAHEVDAERCKWRRMLVLFAMLRAAGESIVVKVVRNARDRRREEALHR
jgi:hypothetical protein